MNEKIILYSTNCPKCHVLESKLKEKRIDFELVTDIDVMESKGFMEAPMLEVGDSVFSFSDAIIWLRSMD